MKQVAVRAFIQARMSSRRFPGKVLAPFQGRPMIAHVVDRVASAIPRQHIVLATSHEKSDDPLAQYAATMGVGVSRGPLEDVWARMKKCLKENPCDWFIRICADSPLLDGAIIRRMLRCVGRETTDLVTNVFPRTFPKGRSVELIRSRTFQKVSARDLRPKHREHVTTFFYDHYKRFGIINVSSKDPRQAHRSLVVDTIEDWTRLGGWR